MEILHHFKQHGYFTSKLYLLLEHKRFMPEDTIIIPSVYVKNMKMSAMERLQNLGGMDLPNIISPDPSKPLKPKLEFSPRIIVFQNFKPYEKIVTKLTVKNIDQAPTFLNMKFEASSYFSIKAVGAELLSRLAPGIGATYSVSFVPTTLEDHVHEVSFQTATERYAVVFIAMGPRPIFDLPDEITIPPTPLKVDKSTMVLVRNISQTFGSFTVKSMCPFSVYPKLSCIQAGEHKEFKVSIKTMHLGNVEGTLLVKYETEETLKIKVKGSVYLVSIELEKSVVRFLDTYNTMLRQQTFKITNKSNDQLTFMCMKNPSIYEDFNDKVKLARMLFDMKESEAGKYGKLVHYDVLTSDEHNRVYTRIFYDEIHSLVADESLQFQNHHFSVMPIQGCLWENNSTEITITFEPKEIGDFQAVMYLDIDGTPDRVPITFQGTSLPPNIYLNVETLDMDNAYINRVYNYEIVAINRGYINGVIQYRPVEALFGSVITCIPEMHCLRPGEREVFVVSFLNSNQGPYFEEIEFFIRETNVVRKLYIKGTIVYPTLTFGTPCMDFGIISVGVPKTLRLEVINESEVVMIANVKISSDGPEISAITLEDCEATEQGNLQVAHWPKEFNIEPCHLELGAFSKSTLQVTLTANLARTNHTFLELELDKSDSPPITLPLTYDAKVPTVSPANDIKLRAAFVDFTYTYEIPIKCDGCWGFFTILPPEEDTQLEVQLGQTRGKLRPNTTMRLPCYIITRDIGPQSYTVRMAVFGLRNPINICHIACMGVKPILTCTPLVLSFGQIKLLEKVEKTLTINNDSPVTVNFKASMLHKINNWEIVPSEGFVEAEADKDLKVAVCLVDADVYTNKVLLQFEKVKDICVPISVTGLGTSIVVGSEKNNDVIYMGRYFCKLPMTCNVPIKNCGTKMHVLEWHNSFKSKKNEVVGPTFFNLEPRYLKLKGGDFHILKVSAVSQKANNIKETWYLVGSVEGINKKELLKTCEFVVEFVDPKVITYPATINFRYDYGPYSEYYKLTDVLTIKNVSKLPLDIEINIKPPFAIIHREGTYKCDSQAEELCCCVCYKESDLNIQKIDEAVMPTREKKIFIDCLTKKPVPNENTSLEFFQDINKLKLAFNLTHSIEETLQDKEFMKIQILFDTTKHTNLKSKMYVDLMRIRFKGHKNKDAVKLLGVINFPNVSVLTPKIDFQCVLNGSVESRILKLYNPTDLLVCYHFQWKKCSVMKTKVAELSNMGLPLDKPTSQKLTLTDDDAEKDSEDIACESLKGSMNFKDLEAGDAPREIEGSVDAIGTTSSLNIEDDFEQFKTRILQKITPMIQLQQNPLLTNLAHKLPRREQPEHTYNINEIFFLMPHQGKLMPDDTHDIHIMFKPCRDFSIRAQLECKVLGGPTEIISVSGQSSDLLYKLNTRTLNFKIRSFHENASEDLIVTNIALFPIEFTTYLNEPLFENDLPATILELVPAESVINAEEEVQIKVQVRVGILGFFSRTFTLELGHLPHIPIEVFGWGVIPQVYICLPRPGMLKIPPEVGYHAIATLTLDYLDAVKDIFEKCSDLHLNSAQLERCFEDPDLQEGWHICSAWDGYPSIMDIELAIERLQVTKYIHAKPEILEFFASTGKGCVIPGYHTTPYVLDFGVTITDTSVTCVIAMVNYGPTPVRVHFAKATVYRHWLDIKLCSKLEPGETGKIEIAFAPNNQIFPEYEQIMDITVYLEVPFGVSIPLNVKSVIAVPALKCNVDRIDFGSVRCGNKVIVSVPLKNNYKPTCIWYVTLKIKTPGPPSMAIMDSSGKYEPGEGGWLSITFRPTMEMTYEAVLIFRFHMNRNKMVIPVRGNGLFPRVHIIGPNMHFPPTLPWSAVTELYFGITNPCPFPIELIIAHVDEEWEEEENRLQLLFRYYNKPPEMLVPAIHPGEGVLAPIKDFYDTFNKRVAKEMEAEAAAAKASAKGAKAKPTPKSPKKDKSSEKPKEPPVRKKRTEAEVIADEIKRMKADHVDPLGDCLNRMHDDSATQKPKHLSGILIFLHGSPGEELLAFELAYTLGMNLFLPTINFDGCIIDALCTSDSVARSILFNIINENYQSLKKCYEDSETEIPPELLFGEFLDEYEIMQKKVELYINYSKTALGTPRSKGSDKKKAGIAPTTSTILPAAGSMIFPQELIEELLKEYFKREKFKRGFVMDSLTSILLRNPSMVLTMAIRCKPSICNIHLAMCLGEFAAWLQRYDEALRAEEEDEEDDTKGLEMTPEMINDIIDQFTEMDADEYECADPHLKAIYIEHGLEERRSKHYDTKGCIERLKSTKEMATNAPADTSADRKKLPTRKEDVKGKSPEILVMQNRYNEYYKNVHDSLIQLACNWIVDQGKIGFPMVGLNGLPIGALPKKGKQTPKSDINVLGSIVDENTEKGFAVTLLMNRQLSFREALVKLFTEIDYHKKMLENEESYDILGASPKIQEFTVLLHRSMPHIQPIQALQWLFLEEAPIRKCECNQITDLNLLDDTTQDNVLNILAKWHCICGKKPSSQTSTSYLMSSSDYAKMTTEYTELEGEGFYPCPRPMRAVESCPVPFKSRMILLPGDLMRCKFIFKPTTEGHFSLKQFVEVAGWPESKLDINSSAISDIPRLDSRPKKMFANFVRKAEDDHVYKHAFLDEHKKFVFGPIFIGPLRIYEEEYTIVLRNASLLTCAVSLEFMNNISDIYQIDKRSLVLEPGCRETITLTAAPAQAGEHENALLVCVTDNPEVVRINITCRGVLPLVEVLPQSKQINYGKLLLYRREDDRFIVKNDSELPVKWSVRNPEDFAEDFILSKTTGIIAEHENEVVPITYTACNVREIIQTPLIIDIFDQLGRGDPMIVDAVYISAECYDVLVECSFDNPTENFLNFGNVKVNSTIYREMYLVNRGLYNIYYKLRKVKNFPEPAVLKSMGADPDYGVIVPGARQVAIEFLVTPSTKVDLRNVPAYTCYLLDGRKDQVIVAKFPVGITIASFYNTFTLFPLGELNFHIIAVGTGIMREVIINNTSKCPFNYEILVPEVYREDSMDQKDPKKIPPIKCGNFCILNDDNLLLPGQSKIIFIQFIATKPKRFNETIHFIVSDTCPAEADGVPLRLVGTGATPMLDFWNLENTFREHLIVKDISEYKVKESTPHCVFEESLVMMHFFCMTVNSHFTGYIDLYNNGLVTARLEFILHYQANTTNKNFSLEKDNIHIDSFQHYRLGIIFTPQKLQEYRAVLEIKIKNIEESESFSLCLVGEGVIPRVRVIKPTIKQHRFGVFHYPVTCLGSTSTKTITLKNIGTVKSNVLINLSQASGERPVFYMNLVNEDEDIFINKTRSNIYLEIEMILKPEQVASVECFFNPLLKGRTNCDITIKIVDNPYEHFTILCDAEAFAEDVILMGIKMMSIEDEDISSSSLSNDSRKKSKSAGQDRKKSKELKKLPPSRAVMESSVLMPAVLRYFLNFGGCELSQTQKRTVIMVNNSDKVYKFTWDEVDNILVKPSIGYISPGEEKDIDILFFSAQPVILNKESFTCHLVAISNDSLTIGNTWDNRQTMTIFVPSSTCINERKEINVDEVPRADESIALIDFIVLYSAISEFTKYHCDLPEKIKFLDTYIYQKREISFSLKNTGNVALRALWNFSIEEYYPARLDKTNMTEMEVLGEETSTMIGEMQSDTSAENAAHAKIPVDANIPVDAKIPVPPMDNTDKNSKATLFSGSVERESVDTWFEMEIPFTIEPNKACLEPGESQMFNIAFKPQEAFQYKIRLKSFIDKLDPYDQNVSCEIIAKALVPYVHMEIEESDYMLIKNRPKVNVPPNTQVLEFKVLGAGCYKKSFNIINPTGEAYEYMLICSNPHKENLLTGENIVVLMHCDKLTGYVEGGMSDLVTFTFAPTTPGTYESLWKLYINKYDLTIPLLVVGHVLEPDVDLIPTILTIPHCLVGFTHTSTIRIRNNDEEDVEFEYKSHTLMNDTGKNPIGVRPKKGVLRVQTETPVTLYYTPITDGPVSFKVTFRIAKMTKPLTLMVNSLSYWIKPEVSYYITNIEHILDYDVLTRINLEQTASTYARRVPFIIRNRGSMTFNYEWKYDASNVKKYLNVFVEPSTGYLAPDTKVECILHFHLRTVPVEAFPVTLSISDGPDYQINLYAELEKPVYAFSSKHYDFGKCFIGAPDPTYKKNLAFTNGDKTYILLTLKSESCPELFVGFSSQAVAPRQKLKIPVYFRPKKIRQYEFKLMFRVNSLCEENIVIRGEGIPLIFDVSMGCEKSFNLGPVKVGDKIIREIGVMNHSQMPIEARFFFQEVFDVYPTKIEDILDEVSEVSSVCLDPTTSTKPRLKSRVKTLQDHRDDERDEQLETDWTTSMESLKVIPAKCTIQPHRKVTLKILFRPVGLISDLQVELSAKVLSTIKPLVLLSGSATGMKICLSQSSLQFGRVLCRGCKLLKVMLMNQGDFGARFWWQPLASNEFTISPMRGYAEAHNDVTINIQFRPLQENPFVKLWANCNIENYKSLDLALYGACLNLETPQSRNLYMECCVRESVVEEVTFTNPTEENWIVLSEISGDKCFQTLREFPVPLDSTIQVPITFNPTTMGTFEANIYFAPLGESALSMTLTGCAQPPRPNDTLILTTEAIRTLTVVLSCNNITQQNETYVVQTEIVRTKPENFSSHYEIRHPQFVKCWGQATAPVHWNFICFDACEMGLKVTFINQETLEYQYYDITLTVTPSIVVDTLKFCCRARESEENEITIRNPLDEEAQFTLRCDSLKIATTVTLFNKAEVKHVTMVYSPLVVGEFEDYLTISNHLTGEFRYRIEGICFPAKEKDMEVTTAFGTSVAIKFRVVNKTDMIANFISWTSDPSIILEKEYELGRLQKGKMLACYEPTELGERNIRVSLNCSVAGEFVFNVHAIATDPLPQGPINVPPGPVGASVTFKNVFTEPHTFRMYLDNEEFFIKKNMELLKAKEKIVVQVFLTEAASTQTLQYGSLTIENYEPADPKAQWTFFLQSYYEKNKK